MSTGVPVDDIRPLRIHFVLHHPLRRGAGVAGATLAIGDAVRALGHEVSYFSFDDAFATDAGAEVPRMLAFPWKVARHLRRHAREFDIIDASTGDAWAWALLGRPGAHGSALATRSHGLEHVVSDELRRQAALGHVHLSAKYPIYHGGWRLREVARSLRAADAQIFLNREDLEYATQRLGVDPRGAVLLPHGIASRMLDAPPSVEWNGSGPIELVFLGTWIPRKGKRELVEMARLLAARNVSFRLRILGSGEPADVVLSDFEDATRPFVTVVPQFEPDALPTLIKDGVVFLHLSWTEGFGLALVEAMAAGLAPVATCSGVATTVIDDGRSGLLLGDTIATSAADAVERLARDPLFLSRMRAEARSAVQWLRWEEIAARTVTLYRDAIARRRAARRPS